MKTLLGTRQVNTIFRKEWASYTIYTLEDFAVIKGIDLVLQKRAFEFFSGSIGYSYTDAKGTGSFGTEFYRIYYGKDIPLPKREYPLEYDVTHSFKIDANLYLPDGFGPSLFGFKPLSDLNTNLQFVFSSGSPYTPTDAKDIPGEVGSKRMPDTHTADLRMQKGIKVKNFNLGLFLQVFNLFDIKNVVDIFTRTGKPDDNGKRPKWDPVAYSTYEEYGYESAWEWYQDDLDHWELYCNDPTHYSDPRIIRFGIEARF